MSGDCDCCGEGGHCEVRNIKKSTANEIEDLKAQLEHNKREILNTVIQNPDLMRKLTAADPEKLDADDIKIPKSSIGRGKTLKELSAHEIDRLCRD